MMYADKYLMQIWISHSGLSPIFIWILLLVVSDYMDGTLIFFLPFILPYFRVDFNYLISVCLYSKGKSSEAFVW